MWYLFWISAQTPSVPGRLRLTPPLDALRRLLVDDLRRVAGDVDERRVVLHQVVDQHEQTLHVAAAHGRDDLEADQGLLGVRQVIGDFHGRGQSIPRPGEGLGCLR